MKRRLFVAHCSIIYLIKSHECVLLALVKLINFSGLKERSFSYFFSFHLAKNIHGYRISIRFYFFCSRIVLRFFTEKKAIVHPGRNAESLTTFSPLASFLFGEIPSRRELCTQPGQRISRFILPRPAGGSVTYRAVSIFSAIFSFSFSFSPP